MQLLLFCKYIPFSFTSAILADLDDCSPVFLWISQHPQVLDSHYCARQVVDQVVGKIYHYTSYHMSESWSISSEKNILANICDPNHFTVFNTISLKHNTFFPSMYKRLYTIHEEVFVLLFKPAIYRVDDLFVTVKCLWAKWIFQRSQDMLVRQSQILWIWWVILTAASRCLELFPWQQHTFGQAHCRDEAAHHDVTVPGVSFW